MRRRKLIFLFIILFALQLLSGLFYVVDFQDSNERKETVYNIQGIPEVLMVKKNKTYKKILLRGKENSVFANENSNETTKRFDILYKTCRQLGYIEDVNLTNIRAHMSPNLEVLYCRVNKCASTMTLELLKQTFNCDTKCLLKVAERVRLKDNARAVMNDAFSFMVVREPYGRLFSTYCNIFYFPKEDWLYRGRKIIELTRQNISYNSLTYGHDLTFAELVKYIVNMSETGNPIDEHVRPMHHKSCNPCLFKFDYIAHLETLQTDFNNIFSELRDANVIVEYSKDIMIALKNWTIFGPIKHLFRTIPLLKGSNISLYDVYLRAWCYYQITGHVSKNIEFPYTRSNVFKIKKDDFENKLKIAMEVSLEDKEKLRLQKVEAMMHAYSTISYEYMERLSNVVLEDCLLFGYEAKPAYLFGKNRSFNFNSNYNYFKGL